MEITEFPEVVEIMKYRKNVKLKDLAELIGKSPTYARQVIEGHQTGPAARAAKKKIAKYLDIIVVN